MFYVIDCDDIPGRKYIDEVVHFPGTDGFAILVILNRACAIVLLIWVISCGIVYM